MVWLDEGIVSFWVWHAWPWGFHPKKWILFRSWLRHGTIRSLFGFDYPKPSSNPTIQNANTFLLLEPHCPGRRPLSVRGRASDRVSGWSGVEGVGVGVGVEWSGAEWSGVEWSEVERSGERSDSVLHERLSQETPSSA